MKRKILSLTAMVLTTITGNAQNHTFKSLTVEAYEQAIADTTVIRLDVRTSEEFAAGHIDRAINIDVLNPDFEQRATSTLPLSKTIAINCRSGKRSKRAAQILVRHGYCVIELDSGFLGWVAAGKKIMR